MEENEELKLAEQYVRNTGVSVFLTGKAGTGKTTFLRHIVETVNKRNVVVAPTGVAAVNARGVTIHSFFQLPFCPYLPDVPELVTEYQLPEKQRQLRKSKLDVIRTLELLIIDEISMVRADLLDAVDATLRRYRRNSRPFGGVQLLLIGDVQQLPPVVTDDEQPYLSQVYPSPFFFHSKAFQQLRHVTIQLTTIYRQQDKAFVDLLNHVRDNAFDAATLAALNARYIPGFDPDTSGADYIRLTTHNHQADAVNQRKMAELTAPPHRFRAEVSGNFPDSSAPTELELTLKEGAQVMFVKNDTSGGHRYYNGKIGIVTRIDRSGIVVTDSDGTEIQVGTEEWQNLKYEIDPADNQIHQLVDGTFRQYPLKPAWAITIHKAQGLTFNHVVIDAAQAFSYGQVYVALSRCRTLEGLVLATPITAACAFNDGNIASFNQSIPSLGEAQAQLAPSQVEYYYSQVFELFDISAAVAMLERINRLYQNHLRTIYPVQAQAAADLCTRQGADLQGVAERFRQQIAAIAQTDDRQLLAQRMAKGAAYFLEQLRALREKALPLADVELANQEVEKQMRDARQQFVELVGLSEACLADVEQNGFDVQRYQKVKADYRLGINRPKGRSTAKSKAAAVYADLQHPKLMPLLIDWRRERSADFNGMAYAVLTNKSLTGICNQLPKSLAELHEVPGIGKAKIKAFGPELLEIIGGYCREQGIPFSQSQAEPELPIQKEKPQKEPAWYKSAALAAQGKTVEEIAAALSLAPSTVGNHLEEAVRQKAIDADLLLEPEEMDELVEYMLDERPETLTEVFQHFGGKYPFYKIKIARSVAQTL